MVKNKQSKVHNFIETYSFDDASDAWNANKKKIGQGCYKYICGYIKHNGNKCNKVRYKDYTYCNFHYKCSINN